MKLQTIFNMAVQHMCRQKFQARNGKIGCAYRGTGGTKCAVGYFITDAEYYGDMEGEDASDARVIAALPFDAPDGSTVNKLLARLQSAHDSGLPTADNPHPHYRRFVKMVENIGLDYNLIVPKCVYMLPGAKGDS